MAATGLELCKHHFIAKAVLPFLDLARQVRNKVTPDWGQVTGKGLCGVTLDMDSCYWFGALPAPLHCRSSSAFPRSCPTSKELRTGAKSRERACSKLLYRHGWLLLVWSSARTTSLQNNSALSLALPDK